MNRNWLTMPALVALAAGLSLAVEPVFAADGCTPGKTKRIAFLILQQGAYRYLHADVPSFKKAAEAAGYEAIVQSADNDAQVQISQAENVITQGVDAVVIQPVDFNVAAGIAEMATKAGIPLASYNDLILGAPIAAYIGRDSKDAGVEAAKALVAKVPKGNYVLIGGDAGQTVSTRMQEGYHEVLDPLVAKGDIKIVMDQFTPGWKTEPAQANAENALTANENKIDVFLSSYDGMTLGILQAIDAAGIEPGKILVTGQDMELSAAQAIVEGRQYGTVWPAPDEMGAAAATVAVAMAQCKDIHATTTVDNGAGQIPWVKTPSYLVSRDEMADFVCKHPYWLKINEVYKNVPNQKPTCN